MTSQPHLDMYVHHVTIFFAIHIAKGKKEKEKEKSKNQIKRTNKPYVNIHNIIHIRNNVMWDWRCFMEYSRVFSHSIIKDLNNVMGASIVKWTKQVLRYTKVVISWVKRL